MLKTSYPLEETIGIRYFVSDTPGIGGCLRERFEDFTVSEVPAEIKEDEAGDYVHFTLEKTNWDTIRAIGALSRALGVSRKRFGFAGTKDKRAVTRQRMAVWKPDYEKLSGLKIKDLVLSDFKRSSERLLVGDLVGNNFEITVRDVEGNKEEITSCAAQISDKGVPNYFGYQRFGTIRPNTHIIGKFLLRNDVKGAVMSYIADYFDAEREDAREARRELKETLDFKKALETFPKRLGYERTMIEHLHMHPADYAGAFRRLHKKLRQMFVHGYQSYLFNLILSRMIEEEAEITRLQIPLIGYNSSSSQGLLGAIEKEVLDEEGVTPADFRLKSLPELSSRGSMRDASLETDITFKRLEEGVYGFGFFLSKGNYATMVMREIMKTDPLRY